MQHPRSLPTILTLCLALTPLAAAQAQEDAERFDLRPRWERDRVTRYRFETQRIDDMTMRFNERSRTAQTRFVSEGEMTWTVREVEADGGAEVEVVYDWIKLSFIPPEGEAQSADSRENAGEPQRLYALVDAIAEAPLTVTFAPDGSVREMTGYERIRRGAEFPDALPEERDMLESVTDAICLPGAPADAEPGDRWEQRFTWGHRLGDMHYDTTYEFVGVERMAGVPVAAVRSESDLRLEVDRGDLPDDAPPLNAQLRSASATQDVLFDLSRHEAVGRRATERHEVLATINAPQARVEQQIVQQIRSTLLRIAEQ